MLLFCRSSESPVSRVVIPVNRVYDILTLGNTIIVHYENGDIVWLDGDRYEKKLETVSIKYEDSDEVDKVIRQFYKACNAGNNAFYFG